MKAKYKDYKDSQGKAVSKYKDSQGRVLPTVQVHSAAPSSSKWLDSAVSISIHLRANGHGLIT